MSSIRLLILAILTLPATPSLAVDDSSDDIRITADSMQFDYATGSSEYRGNVRIHKGDITLTGDSVHIDKRSDDADIIVVTGNPARYSQSQGEDPVEAQSNNMLFDISTEILTMKQSAELLHDGQLIKSDLIRFDTRNQVLLAGQTDTREPAQRVNITLTPNRPKQP